VENPPFADHVPNGKPVLACCLILAAEFQTVGSTTPELGEPRLSRFTQKMP